MCLSVHHQHRVVLEARETLDRVLDGCPVATIAKAMDLRTPTGFDRAVAAFAAGLAKDTRATDREAVKAAVAALDVDWPSTTAEQRRQLVDGALRAAGRRLVTVPKTIEGRFGRTATDVARAARVGAIDRHGLRISVDFGARDTAAIEYVQRSSSLFVSDELRRRLDDFGAEARRLVADGMERGLGRVEISGELARAAETQMVARSAAYWDVIAASFVANARSWSQIGAYADAGIQRYVIEAVLDEHTTEICLFLDGKSFSVGDALDRFDRLSSLESPEDIKEIAPWVRSGRDADGNPILYVKQGGERVQLAQVDRAGTGQRDRHGEYSRAMSARDMNDAGVGFPPYHGLCRSTTVADI